MGKNPKSKKTTSAASTQRFEDGRADESNQDETNSNNVLSLFPKSEHYVKVLSFGKKGNQYKTNKIGLTWGHFSDGDNEVLFIVQ